MQVTVQVEPSPALTALLQRARNLPAESLQALGKALAMSGPMIVGNSVKHRYTAQKGPFPVSENKLGRVTGRLRQSITATKPQIKEGESSVTIGFGSNVRYWAVHEFGYSGSVPVRAHQRQGRPVRAHSRMVNIAARAPMTTELQHPRTTDIVLENARRQLSKMLDDMEGGRP